MTRDSHNDFLIKIARFHRSAASRSNYLLLSASLSAVGVLLFLYPVYGAIQRGRSLVLGDLAFGVAGLMGVFAGWFIRIVLCMSRVAHEVLLRLDDDYDGAHTTETDSHQEGIVRKSAEGGSSFHSLSKSKLRELSTRDLTAGWRLLVMVPLVVGGLLLALSIGAWQVPAFGTILLKRGVRLEYLCIAGLMFMSIGAYMMPLGGIVYRRASERDERSENVSG